MIGRDAVGICFRCGSTEHTLSRCRKPALKNDELPYATCFICHSKGHLSSKCPNNAGEVFIRKEAAVSCVRASNI